MRRACLARRICFVKAVKYDGAEPLCAAPATRIVHRYADRPLLRGSPTVTRLAQRMLFLRFSLVHRVFGQGAVDFLYLLSRTLGFAGSRRGFC